MYRLLTGQSEPPATFRGRWIDSFSKSLFSPWFLHHHRLNTRDMLNRKITIYPFSNVSVAHKVLKKHFLISSLTETWHSITVLGIGTDVSKKCKCFFYKKNASLAQKIQFCVLRCGKGLKIIVYHCYLLCEG